MSDKPKDLAIYARSSPTARYMAMDMNRGVQTRRKIFVSRYPEAKRQYLEDWCKEMTCDHFSSDVHTSVTISEDEALEIVAFLARAFRWSDA